LIFLLGDAGWICFIAGTTADWRLATIAMGSEANRLWQLPAALARRSAMRTPRD
jgi:hypothetical protein